MPKYTKDQAHSAIALIADNINKSNTPAIVRSVLEVLKDMEQLASYIKHSNSMLGTSTVEDTLTALSESNIPAWSAKAWPPRYFVYYSGVLFRSNQQILVTDDDPTVTSSKWDPYPAGYGVIDFSLKYKGSHDLTQYASLSFLFPHVNMGDFFIAKDIHGSFAVQNLDWVIALADDATFEAQYQTSQWMVIPFSSFSNVLSISEIVTGIQSLVSTQRLTKSAIRGADFSLNRRGEGDIYDGNFKSGMSNILKGDFWIYRLNEPSPPTDLQTIFEGDWVVAMTDYSIPSLTNYQDPTKWWILNFSQKSRTIPDFNLRHYRTTPTSESPTLNISDVQANIISLTINKLTYYGKFDDGSFGIYDFVYRFIGNSTLISINPDVLVSFESGMVIDVIYIAE